jgi:hypothetical protein
MQREMISVPHISVRHDECPIAFYSILTWLITQEDFMALDAIKTTDFVFIHYVFFCVHSLLLTSDKNQNFMSMSKDQ